MKTAIISISSLITLTAVGSVAQLPQIPYIVIASVITVTLLIAFNKINVKYYPIYIFGLALSLLYQTSMLGYHIVGVDIHTEYFVVNRIIESGWNVDWLNNSNMSVVMAWFTPFLNWIGISPTWAFKAVYPIACAGAPVVLYFAFKRMLEEKRAYFSCLFFMTMPMFTMEVVSIVKSMWAYLFVACIVFFLTSDYKAWVKTIGISLSATMVLLTHYSVGIITVYYLIGILGVLTIVRWFKIKRFASPHTIPVKYMGLATVTVIMAFVLWFGNVGQGAMIRIMFAVAGNISDISKEIAVSDSSTIQNSGLATEYLAYTTPSKDATYLDMQSPLVRTAIGLDFMDTTPLGKTFRVMQYLTQGLLVLGFITVIRKRKFNFSAEYTASIITSFTLLTACILIPFFTTTLSATRYYAITLFFISPLIVIGIEEVSHWIKRPQLLQ